MTNPGDSRDQGHPAEPRARPPLPRDYEFETLAVAANYRRGIVREFHPYLHGDLLEVGSGVGLVTRELRHIAAVRSITAVEPDVGFCAHLCEHDYAGEIIQGTVADVPPGREFDAVVCVNVLEHVRDDDAELAAYYRRLVGRGGHLCLFVPAGSALYAPLDHDFGHFRRYDARPLAQQLARAGFELVTLHYFNGIGYLLWWLEFKVLKRRGFQRRKVWLFDRLAFPLLHAVEAHICRPPRGQSILAVARARPAPAGATP